MPHPPGTRDAAFRYYPALQRVRDYVEGHLGEDISLHDAAVVARLEKKYFSAFFRRKTGIGFRCWLSQIRIQRAQEMLRERDHTITNVALAVGFRDLRTFERAFKRDTGMTPRAFKAVVKT